MQFRFNIFINSVKIATAEFLEEEGIEQREYSPCWTDSTTEYTKKRNPFAING